MTDAACIARNIGLWVPSEFRDRYSEDVHHHRGRQERAGSRRWRCTCDQSVSPLIHVSHSQREDSQKITIQATGATSWRRSDVKYRKNEAFVDVVESVNLLMSSKGGC